MFVGYVVDESLGSNRDFSTAWFLSPSSPLGNHGVEGLEDLAGAGFAIESHAQSAACAVLNFQPSSPACFSTSLEDLAGSKLVNDTTLEDHAGKA